MLSTCTPQQAAQLFKDYSENWWIAGGRAIDLFLGEETRPHEDTDIAILRVDERSFRSHLKDWELWPGLGGGELESQPLAIDDELPANREVLWCRPSATSDWAFELLLNKTDGEDWVFKRDESIRMPITSIGLVTDDGIPYLKPEIVLLFKAKNQFDKDQHDFEHTVTRLSKPSLDWLHDALQTVHPGHPWLQKLS